MLSCQGVALFERIRQHGLVGVGAALLEWMCHWEVGFEASIEVVEFLAISPGPCLPASALCHGDTLLSLGNCKEAPS